MFPELGVRRRLSVGTAGCPAGAALALPLLLCASRWRPNLPWPLRALSLIGPPLSGLPRELNGTRVGLSLLSHTSQGPRLPSSSLASSHFGLRFRSVSVREVRRAARSGEGARDGRGGLRALGSRDPAPPLWGAGCAGSFIRFGFADRALAALGALGSLAAEEDGPSRASAACGRVFAGTLAPRGPVSLCSAVTNRSSPQRFLRVSCSADSGNLISGIWMSSGDRSTATTGGPPTGGGGSGAGTAARIGLAASNSAMITSVSASDAAFAILSLNASMVTGV